MIDSISDNKRLYQKVGAHLREAIRAGQYRVGERFPPERDVAEQMGVSRAVVREALIMLELEGLIDVRKGSGVYVIGLPRAVSEDAATEGEDVGPFELIQARQLLESNIAAFAATQVTKNDIAQMRQALEAERIALEDNNLEEDYRADEQFHMLIAQSTQNGVLIDIARNLWSRRVASPMWLRLHAHIVDHSYRLRWLEDHRRILSALQRRDPQSSRQAMWQHLENVKQTLLALSDVDDPDFDGFLFSSDPLIVKD